MMTKIQTYSIPALEQQIFLRPRIKKVKGCVNFIIDYINTTLDLSASKHRMQWQKILLKKLFLSHKL